MLKPARKKSHNDEWWLAAIVIVMAVLLGSGFFGLMFAMNRHEQAAGHPQATGSQMIAPEEPRQLVDFSLTDRTGRTITRADLSGQFLVVDFVLTSCSLTCPVVNRCMAQVQQLTTNQPDVKLVSLTVNPRDDTVEALAGYGERFGADPDRWLLLTGKKQELYRLINTSFLAQDRDDPAGYMPGNFAHTERIALVDRQGNVRVYFDGLNDRTADAIVNEISRLRK